MAIVNHEAAIKLAKDLTTTAIEHNLIVATNNASQTADNVYEFYKTLYTHLSGRKIEED